MKTKVCLKYFVNYCLWKQFVATNCPQTLSNLICLTIFLLLRPLKQFQPKIKATNLQKRTKFFLLDNFFPDLFTEVRISH